MLSLPEAFTVSNEPAHSGPSGAVAREQRKYSSRIADPTLVEFFNSQSDPSLQGFTEANVPDGYTIALITSSTHAINIRLYGKPGYDPVKDFTPITVIGEVSNVTNRD